MSTHSILIIIPARGGSKGIPRKNLRPLNKKPLISYSIKTALASKYSPDVYVSSEDDEILMIAEKNGAGVIKRDGIFSTDEVTLDPVIYNALEIAESKKQSRYDLVVTMQPTSPLLKTGSLDAAIEKILTDSTIDTVISAQDDTHLSWRSENGSYRPNYKERLNRQYLIPQFKETGGFLISRRTCVSDKNRIGANVDLYILKSPESIDIDTFEDWQLCEYHLRRKKILFVVAGYPKIGLGHVYNSLLIANDLISHEIEFLVDKKSQLAFEKISSFNYKVSIQTHDDLSADILKNRPDLVIIDALDTDAAFIKSLKENGVLVATFEDLGSGAKEADLVINAIYPEEVALPNHYFGPNYFCIRDEFLMHDEKQIKPIVDNILITFGGVDPNNFTKKVLKSVVDYCKKNDIKINIVLGFGYTNIDSLSEYIDFDNVQIHTNISNISDFMYNADIVFTSAGRTTYEIASLGTPAIVLAQNEREMTHFFASAEYGFINLGLGYNVSFEHIEQVFANLCSGYSDRVYMSNTMLKHNLKQGRFMVNSLIEGLLNEEN